MESDQGTGYTTVPSVLTLKHSHVICQRNGEIILWATVTVDKRVRTVREWSELHTTKHNIIYKRILR